MTPTTSNPDIATLTDQLRALLPELRERYGVDELGVFGSRVRGDHRPDSDLDVLVTFQLGRTPGLIGFGRVEEVIEEAVGLRVDLVPRNALRPYIRPYILAEVRYL